MIDLEEKHTDKHHVPGAGLVERPCPASASGGPCDSRRSEVYGAWNQSIAEALSLQVLLSFSLCQHPWHEYEHRSVFVKHYAMEVSHARVTFTLQGDNVLHRMDQPKFNESWFAHSAPEVILLGGRAVLPV